MVPASERPSDLTIMGILWARLYYAFAKEIFESLGASEGKKLLVSCIRRFASIRGEAIANNVRELGLPYDAESFVKHYDSCFSELQKAFMRDCYRKELPKCDGVSYCPYLDLWQDMEDGRELALIYCEEFHEAMWAAYHPDLRVRQDKIMARGDSICTFETYMAGQERDSISIFHQD